jgi:YggT family protein
MDAPVQNNQIANWIYRVTDPVLIPFQKLIPPIGLGGMYLDLSPILIFFVYQLLGTWIINTLSRILLG